MKVRFLVSVAGLGLPKYDLLSFGFAPGEVATLHPDLAAKWIAKEICVAVVEQAAAATSKRAKRK